MYDCVIIGGGAAGMSAAIYAARGGLKTVIIEGAAMGGQALKTNEIDNYPGFYDNPTGMELMERIEKHAHKFDIEFAKGAVKSIENAAGEVKTVKTRRAEYQTKTIIIATGAKPKKLGIPGEEEYMGAGVSYCATCDGMFFKGKRVTIIGGGNTAVEDLLYLSTICRHVLLLNRSDELRASKILVDKAMHTPYAQIIIDATPDEIIGDGKKITGIKVHDTDTLATLEVPTDAVFIAIGITPTTDLFKGIVELCPRGFVKTDEYMRTSVRGIFAAGDVRVSPLRQVITAASDGAVAATSAISYVNTGEWK